MLSLPVILPGVAALVISWIVAYQLGHRSGFKKGGVAAINTIKTGRLRKD